MMYSNSEYIYSVVTKMYIFPVHYGAFWKKIGRFPILQATFFDFGSILVYYGRIELAFLPLLATTWVIYGQSLEIYYVN